MQTVSHPTSLFEILRNHGAIVLSASFHCIIVLKWLPEQSFRDTKLIVFSITYGAENFWVQDWPCIVWLLLLFSISTPHPMFQADEVHPVIYSTFIFNGPGPFPTVPTIWNVLTPTYCLPKKLLLILQGHLGTHQSVTVELSVLPLSCLQLRIPAVLSRRRVARSHFP